MIKLLEFVRRNPGITRDNFHAHWSERTRAFFADTPAARKLVQRCELNHRLPEDYQRERHATEVDDTSWDGVAVSWFANLADYEALQQLPAFIEFKKTEHQDYRAKASARVLTNDATVIVDRPGGRDRAGLKLICILRRNEALDRATFYPHWKNHHGGLFQNVPELNEPVLAYDQNHGLDIEGAEYDGVTEQWFVSLPEWIDSIGVPANYSHVIPDVQYMLDPNATQFILSSPPELIV